MPEFEFMQGLTRRSQPVDLVLYHADCLDGSCAAWVASTLYPEAQYIACNYGDPVGEWQDKNILILDFSFSLDAMHRIAKIAKTVLIMDHHKTAIESLTNLPSNVQSVFDIQRSGARIVWDYYYPNTTPLWIVSYVEDRDLWKFSLHMSEEVSAYLRDEITDIKSWKEILDYGLNRAREHGAIRLHSQKQAIKRICSQSIMVKLDGYDVPMAIAPIYYSEVAGNLAIAYGAPFAISLYIKNGKWNYSLRSRGDFDVSEVAKRYGGGGHKSAASFSTSLLVHR